MQRERPEETTTEDWRDLFGGNAPEETTASSNRPSGNPFENLFGNPFGNPFGNSPNSNTTPSGSDTSSEGTQTAIGSSRSPSSSGDGGSGRGSRTVGCRRCRQPDYPEELRRQGVEGEPVVRVEFDDRGRVIGVILERSSGNPALDRAAMDAARDWRMDSGGKGGQVSVEIPFVIEGSEEYERVRERGDRRSVEIQDEETTASSESERDGEQSTSTSATDTPQENSNASQENTSEGGNAANQPASSGANDNGGGGSDGNDESTASDDDKESGTASQADDAEEPSEGSDGANWRFRGRIALTCPCPSLQPQHRSS
ncbi:MAG: energy transducer TonB, partial [Coleofasciculaceae cyanobacterium SM2_3_26]|nr:energy transducer TonB [Coleofasciculaceae cyanobacterium SM2_3_26]